MNILIIGTGMYACGRGTDGYGTTLPAVCEWKRLGNEFELFIAGASLEGVEAAKEKLRGLNKITGVDLKPQFFPYGAGRDPDAYKEAVKKIPRPACAVIVVPDHLHREVAGFVIENGLHPLVVKPLAPGLKEVNELVELSEREGVYGAVEFHKRYDRSNLKLKDAIRQGLIGDILYFIVEYSQRKSIPTERFNNWIDDTNIFQYLGVHYVDIIYFATGALPKRVLSMGQKGYLASKGIDNFDSIQAVVEWETRDGKSFTSSFFTNWIDPERTSAMSNQRIKVIGTKGRFEADQKNRGLSLTTDYGGIEDINPDFCSTYGWEEGDISYRGYGIESHVQFFKDIKAIEDGNLRPEELEGKRPTFKESIVPTAVVEAANRSLMENGRWVEIGLK